MIVAELTREEAGVVPPRAGGRLAGRVAVVTGAAGGVGRACARRYALEGASVLVADVSRSAGERVVAQIRAAGGVAAFQRTDVGDPGQLDTLLAVALERFGGVSVWHNNAFGGVTGDVVDPHRAQTPAELDESVRACLQAYSYGSLIAGRQMVSAGAGGVLINTASRGHAPHGGRGAHDTLKGAVLSLTRSVGAELAPAVRSVAIATAFVPARATEAADGFPRQSRHPGDAQRPCQDAADHEFAAVAAFLASDDAAYITATGLVVDGNRLTV